ncbi:MAG: hypothetical protein R6U58_08555 [Bacteroidales bacterium]
MKKYGFHITGMIVLALLAIFLHEYRKGTSLDRRETAFSIDDYESIEQISISDRDEKVTLKKMDGVWILNSRFEARKNAVDMLLKTFGRLRVSSPVSLDLHEEITEKLLTSPVRVDINLGRRSKTYFVYSAGASSPTYMIMKGSSQPYIIEVLGFSGNVASLFVSDESFWRSNILFNYTIDEIAEVFVYHRENEEESFTLRQSPGQDFSLHSYPGGKKYEVINDSISIRYLSGFFYTPYERVADHSERMLIDSLAGSCSDHIIKVVLRDGSFSEVFFHKIRTDEGRREDNRQFDPFRLHALIDDKSEMVIVPYHSVDLLLRPFSYFPGRQGGKTGD